MTLRVVTKDELDAIEHPQHGTWHRPYARQRGSEPSVTTLIGLLDKPGLQWGAAKETALYAVFHDDWRSLEPAEAVDLLRRHHHVLWDGRAGVGTACHAVLQAWCAGETVDVAELVESLSAKVRIWQGDEERVVAEVQGYVDGLEAFFNAHQPRSVAAEQVVRTPGLYIGQTDLLAEIHWPNTLTHPAGRFLTRLDLKCTGEQDPEKAIYTREWLLQLVGYDCAEQVVNYRDENGKPVECCTEPNVRAERCAVIHLRGSGHYELYEVFPDDDAYAQFVGLVGLNTWLKKLSPAVAVTEKGET